ncbi:MAG: transglycosylase domain-containing protein [Anaerolineae bacterium]
MTPNGTVRYIALRRHQRRRTRDRTGIHQVLRILGILLLAVLITISASVVGAVGAVTSAYSYFTRDLPEPHQIEAAEENFETTEIYDRTGQHIIARVIDPTGGERTWVYLDQLPDHLINATVASEDRSYWENPGFNPRGIARAFWADIRGQEIQGGSSITQQLIKNIVIKEELRYVSPEGPEWEDYERKITEILLSHRITQKYTKEQILEWYLNTNFYGNLAYGIEAAAQVYFGKSASELTPSESATLVAIPQYPRMNPFDNPEMARRRQGLVLDAMVRDGYISTADATAAKDEPWDLAKEQSTERFDMRAPHFAVHVRDQLETMPEVGPEALYRGGLRVYTTVDLDLQEQAECVAQAQIRRLSGEDEAIVIQQAVENGCEAAQFLPPLSSYQVGRDHDVINASVVAIRPGTGEILAMVGSLDYWDESIDGQFNVAMDGQGRQPGSSFKPFTYVTLLSQGYNAAHAFLDVRQAFRQPAGKPYVPENYDRKYHGPQRLRLALARSYNIPAVAALEIAGVDNVIRTAHRMGINTLDRGLDYYGLSLTLGGGEVHLLDMVYAFSVFANNGNMYGVPVLEEQLREGYRQLDPVAILRVEDRNGNVLYKYENPESRTVLSPQLAYLMNHILSDEQARWAAMGLSNPLELSNDRPAAAKTGTTNDFRDAWTIGYTPQLAVGVWVGNTDNSMMNNLPGLRGAGPIWHAVMGYALRDEPPAPFTRPDGLIESSVCAVSGKLPTEHCPAVTEIFIPGTEPTEDCDIHQAYLVNRETGRLCTVHTPPELCEEKVYEVYPPEAESWIASLPEDQRPETPPTQYDTTYGPSRSDAQVAIVSPESYSYVSGLVPVTGNARSGDFNFYRLVFGMGLSPTEWIQIGPDHGNQVDHGLLENWDTSELDGLYSLRLQVVDHSSNVQETTIQVTVDNISPTLDLNYPEEGSEYELGYHEWVNVNAEVQDYSMDRVEFYEFTGSKDAAPADLQPFSVRRIAPFNVNWTLDSSTGFGSHTFYVVAVDAAGNKAKSDLVTIQVVPRREEE